MPIFKNKEINMKTNKDKIFIFLFFALLSHDTIATEVTCGFVSDGVYKVNKRTAGLPSRKNRESISKDMMSQADNFKNIVNRCSMFKKDRASFNSYFNEIKDKYPGAIWGDKMEYKCMEKVFKLLRAKGYNIVKEISESKVYEDVSPRLTGTSDKYNFKHCELPAKKSAIINTKLNVNTSTGTSNSTESIEIKCPKTMKVSRQEEVSGFSPTVLTPSLSFKNIEYKLIGSKHNYYCVYGKDKLKLLHYRSSKKCNTFSSGPNTNAIKCSN